MDWVPGFEKKLAENKYLDAFVELSRSVGPRRARNTPPWLMKLLTVLVMSAHERTQRLGLLREFCASIRKRRGSIIATPTTGKSLQASSSCMAGKVICLRPPAVERLAAALPRSETQEFPMLDHFGIDKKAPRAVASAVSDYFLTSHLWGVPSIPWRTQHHDGPEGNGLGCGWQ
jgi:hypothetical protein